jgi:KDO2-lipid IV(A) lauroyltransferase
MTMSSTRKTAGPPTRTDALPPSERLLRALLRLLARLPLRLVHGIGSLVGGLIALFPNRQRRNALINIALCRPDLSAVAQRRLRNRALRAFGSTYLEVAHFWLRPHATVMGLVREVRGAELLRREPGRGLIVLSPHLGAWELAGLYLSEQGPTAIFYKPQRHFDDLIVAARARGGATLAPITAKGIRVLVQALGRGEYVGILPDQEPRGDKGAVFAPFFGIPAFTMLLVNRLARRSGAPVIFMFAERLPKGRGYRMHCIRAPEGIDSDDEVHAAAALNQGIAQCVLTCPEQYLWPYRRFRRRPEGLGKVYTGSLDDFAAQEHARRLRLGLPAAEPAASRHS